MNELWAISGASGFVGRALRAELTARGIPSRGLTREAGAAEVAGDVRDRAALELLVKDAGVVVHLAAYVHRSTRGREAAEACWSVNVEGTQAMIDALAAVAPQAFLLHVSSASVYGSGNDARAEDATLHPRTPYGLAKAEAEQRVLSAVTSGRIRGCVLRPAMIFGRGAPGNLERLHRMVRRGWAVEVDRGSQLKSIVPVSSAVAAILSLAAHRERCNGEVLNLAGETLSMHQIMALLAGERPLHVLSVPRWLVSPAARFLSMLETYTTNAVLTDDKLRRLTGFVAPESVADALRRLG